MRFLFILIVASFSLSAQKKYVEPDEMKSFNITVNYDDYTVKTQMLRDGEKVKVDNELAYLWYKSNKIIETKGGYDGRLLHGYYKTFYLNNQLKEQGEIKYGLKHKEWKYWYNNGMLKEVITWKDGRKNGTYLLYNDYGKLMAKGTFKKDLLHGKFTTYDAMGNAVDTKKYKNGSEIPPKIKKQKAEKQKKNKTENDALTDENKENKNQPKAEKKTFGQKLKSIFKKKDKKSKPAKEEKKPETTTS